jgi:hypothetical protein
MSRVKDTILFLGPIVDQDTDDYAHGERVRHRTYLTAHSVGIIVEVTSTMMEPPLPTCAR